MRLIGAMLILLCSGSFGLLVAQAYVRRPKELKTMISLLQSLETEIHWARNSLPEALTNLSSWYEPPIKTFLEQVVLGLNQADGLSASEAWHHALEALDESALSPDDKEIIGALGPVLGRTDADDQKKHLALLQKQLEKNWHFAEEERGKNVKLWNYLGFCVGALLIVLLY